MNRSTIYSISLAFLALATALVLGCDTTPSAPGAMSDSDAAALSPSGGLETVVSSSAQRQGGGPLPRPVVFVLSQELYYDSIVTADPLPMRGRFQELREVGGELQTDVGPGDPGYLGGRWWMDTTAPFGEMNEGDHYFMCPLLGPGRESP